MLSKSKKIPEMDSVMRRSATERRRTSHTFANATTRRGECHSGDARAVSERRGINSRLSERARCACRIAQCASNCSTGNWCDARSMAAVGSIGAFVVAPTTSVVEPEAWIAKARATKSVMKTTTVMSFDIFLSPGCAWTDPRCPADAEHRLRLAPARSPEVDPKNFEIVSKEGAGHASSDCGLCVAYFGGARGRCGSGRVPACRAGAILPKSHAQVARPTRPVRNLLRCVS